MKIQKGNFLILTSDNLFEITGLRKKILFSVSLFVTFVLVTSILLGIFFGYYEKKQIENEISVLKKQKEISTLQYDYLEGMVSGFINERKEKDNLKRVAYKLNPNVNQEFLKLWVDIIYENHYDIEESLNDWSKIKLSPEESPYSLKLSSAIVLAVIAIESNFNTNLISNKGAVGIFQIVDNTANELGLKDPWNPVENINGGIRYLTYLLKTFKDYPDQIHLTFASYNAGPSRVAYEWMPMWGDSWNSIHKGLISARKSYRETREYSVLAFQMTKLFSSGQWINKDDNFWINYKNEILATSTENLSSVVF